MRLYARGAAALIFAVCLVPCLQCGSTGSQIFGQTADWQRRTVNGSANVRPTVVQIFDFDGDGKPDIVAGYEGSSAAPPSVFIFFQTDVDNWVAVQIGIGAELGGITALALGDLDADGHTDVVAACNGSLRYLHSPADPRSAAGWTVTAIANSNDSGVGQWSDAVIGNIDSANGLDIVASNSTKNWLSWFVNPGNAANGTGWTRVQIDAGSRTGSAAVAIDDVDADGRNDVVSSAPGETSARIAWYKNPTDPVNGTWTKSAIGNQPGAARIAIGDLNVDGRNDVVVINGPGKTVGWYLHPATATSTWTGYLLTQFVNPAQSPPAPDDVKVAFINADQQPDVVIGTKTPGRLRWFLPVGTQINLWGENNVRDLSEDVGRIAVADINGDGKPDIVASLRASTADQDSIAWFQNPGF